jgi:hypothetical protein
MDHKFEILGSLGRYEDDSPMGYCAVQSPSSGQWVTRRSIPQEWVTYRPDDGGICIPETSANFYETTRRNVPEDSSSIENCCECWVLSMLSACNGTVLRPRSWLAAGMVSAFYRTRSFIFGLSSDIFPIFDHYVYVKRHLLKQIKISTVPCQ